MSDIPPGNNLISRLSGMLVGNVCILRWGILRSSGDTQLPWDDSRLTLLEESVADLLEECCAFSGLIGDQLLGRVLLSLVLLCRE